MALCLESVAVKNFICRADLSEVSQRGPSTLEHVICTKRVPLIDGDIEGFVARYRQYFDANAPRHEEKLTPLAPTPRVILDPDLGLVTTGKTHKDAKIAQGIYRHTMRVIEAAEKLGGYRTVTEENAFDVEYWELEQRKIHL